MFTLGVRSKTKLKGVHPDLVKVVERALKFSTIDFAVLEGLRTLERQKILVSSGASQTMNSRHLTGHAVDLGAWVDDEIRWDWPLYAQINDAMRKASIELNIPVVWGGGWKTFRDGPHFELSRKEYP